MSKLASCDLVEVKTGAAWANYDKVRSRVNCSLAKVDQIVLAFTCSFDKANEVHHLICRILLVVVSSGVKLISKANFLALKIV